MPELPDILNYLDSLQRFVGETRLAKIVIKSPFVLRTFEPPIEDCENRILRSFDRFGKRIVWKLEGNLNLVFHLMITGRFHWKKPGVLPRGKNDLAAFQFEHGTMMLTEAGTRKRASIHVATDDSLQQFSKPALEVFNCTQSEFMKAIRSENRTIKRALTNPKLISGIGNAYSDEILLAAGISPFQRTSKMTNEQLTSLFESMRRVLQEWIDRLKHQTGDKFPERVTAFRKEMLAHGKYNQPCQICGTPIQRVIYAENEMNYCPLCQTGGKILADRSLSRLLKDDWPKTIDELLDEEDDHMAS